MEHWYCIYTKQGMTEQVCRRLSELSGIEVLNPKLRINKFRRGRLSDVVEDLFPGYFFSRLDLSPYYRLIKYTRGVKSFVGDFSGKPYIVEDSIIQEIRSRITDGFVRIGQSCLRFEEGDRIMIKDGPLQGFPGIFLQDLHARERVLILLNAITYQAKIEIEQGCIDKVQSCV